MKKVFVAIAIGMVITVGYLAAGIMQEPEIQAVVVPKEPLNIETTETTPEEQETAPIYTVYQMTPDDLAAEEYDDSLEELAICVEAEAGNQSLLGKRMVVDVILNRVDDPDWPDDIKSVIEQYPQFSSYWDGQMEAVWSPSEETYEAIRMELAQRSYPQIYYFTAGGYGKYGTPWRQVGDHYFCTK